MPFSIAGPSSPALPTMKGINQAAQRISSGVSVDYRSNAAESAISGRLDSSVGETTISVKNITDQLSSLQKADDTLGYISDLVERAQSFEVQANNGALNSSDRDIIKRSQTDLLQEAQSALTSASFNDQPLFQTDAGKALIDKLAQAAASSAPGSTVEASPTGSDTGTSSAGDALQAVSGDISSLRATLGAQQGGLENQANQLLDQQLTDSGRRSAISDTDYAVEVANLLKEELQFKASVTVFNQQRLAEEAVLGLLT